MGLSAQSNLRSRVVDAFRPLQMLDTLTLMPPLVSVQDSAGGTSLAPQLFGLYNRQLRIDTAALRAACPSCTRLRVWYRVLPFDLGSAVSRVDTGVLRKALDPRNSIEFDYRPYNPTKTPWETGGGIRSNGAYARGLSFGNNQNLVFNSNLNLQLDGKLGNDLTLQAALSDNSVPLQPDGTTRQLNEFDRIFIQLRRRQTAFTAGDYDLTRPSGYFQQYFKRLQGAMWEDQKVWRARDTLSFRAAAAVSKGKFARQTIQGQEGNQGPYRLQGAEGERFIIVLANTEKVFVDGQPLRRGQDDDYVIDYNLGEVTFTARRLITKDIRIIVEFEYATQNFLRSTAAANAYWNRRRARAYFHLYSEQDGRNNGAAQDLSPEQRRQLALAGDRLRDAYASGIDTLADFDPGRVLYRFVDTLVCGQVQRVLRYSTNPDSARYGARFTEVPQGQGNYVLALSSVNGRVFRWVAPDPLSCQPRGNFEPVVRLIAPEMRQLYSTGGEVAFSKNGRARAELALSNRDLNRFSPLDQADNIGAAGYAAIQQAFAWKDWGGQGYAQYEHTSRRFLPLNPYRPAEFVRDWNNDRPTDTVAEHLAKSGFSLQRKNWGQMRYEWGTFQRQGVYDGQRHSGAFRLQRKGFELMVEGNLLATDGLRERTRFSRPKIEIAHTFSQKKGKNKPEPAFKIGLYGERERNERRPGDLDTLQRSSFWYDLGRFYFQTARPEGRWKVGGFLSQRNDFFPLAQGFKGNTVANEANVNGAWQSAPAKLGATRERAKQSLTWNLSYRKLRVLDADLTTQTPQATYLGRLDHTLSAWKNALNLTTGYELGSGQSPKVEFNYLLVNPGQGQYTWVDRNRDSILQVDEMEIAVFQDQASYVRVAVNTTQYVRTNNVLLNQNLRFEPRLLLGTTAKGWRRTAGRLAAQSTFQVNRRTFAAAQGIDPWNPFALDIPDTALVSVNLSARQVLFLNRANPKWDASLAYGDQRSQVALTTGYERRQNADWTLHGRINVSRQWSVETDVRKGQKASDNQAFDTRDFDLAIWEATPKVSWLPSRQFRLTGKLRWQSSVNTLPSAEKADQWDWNSELTWNPVAKENAQGFKPTTSIRGRFTLASIRFTGAPNSAVAFNMLEGLQDGRNFLWGLQLDRQLSKNMQISVQYEGRKTGDNKVVHVGRAQVRAVF